MSRRRIMPKIKLTELTDNPTRIRTVGFEEIIYERIVEINEELKRINDRLDKLLEGEEVGASVEILGEQDNE